MVCILQPECNFLHSFFRCHLQIKTVDIELKITLMQGTHTFRRDRTSQLIKCTPWNTRLCPHPTIVEKLRTFLELEGELGQDLSCKITSSDPQPDTNPHIRKETKATEKRKRLAPTKMFKVKVVARPNTNKATVQPLQVNTKTPISTESQRNLDSNSREQPSHP